MGRKEPRGGEEGDPLESIPIVSLFPFSHFLTLTPASLFLSLWRSAIFTRTKSSKYYSSFDPLKNRSGTGST